MSRRNKYKLEKIKYNLRKNVFSMKFPVRNLLVMMISFAVVCMSVMAVGSLRNAKNGDKMNSEQAAGAAVTAGSTEAPVKSEAKKSEVSVQKGRSNVEAVKADKAVKVNKSAVDHNTVSESKYDMTGKFIVTADELNIRATGDAEAEVIGTLYKDYVGEVVKADGEWIEIKSGDISGFVKAEYILTDDKASEYITSIGGLEKANYAVAAAKDAETDDQDETTEENQTDDTDTDSDDDDDTETPSEEDTEEVTEEQTTEAEETTTEEVTEEPTTETEEVTEEVTTEEPTTEAATEAHEQYSGDTGVHAAGGFSAEEVRLLAAIVYAESGSESYEGQVAVANVVLNRLYSGRWGGSLNDVIYAPYQFSATDTWAFSDVYSNGAPDTTMCAVYDALNGYNNIGGYLSFRPIWYLDPSELDDCIVIGNHVFF